MFRQCYVRAGAKASMPNGPCLPVAALRSARYREFVTDRHWAGSWLSGQSALGAEQKYPGQRLGLPETGPRSVAGVGRRLGALLIDWLLCSLIAIGALHNQLWTIVVFAAEVYLLTATTGFTIGKRLLGLRVVRLDGRPVGLLWSLIRVVLLLAVVPPLLLDKDLRGLHDKAANTIVIRT
jgi:hypothetical protein